ncbi:hypothetical protein cand_019620 [Cryptosporidium andersoni]|uniref:Histone RNA hairpin-binding protein RNA-binding domain-containing protein n=1 Tax=Cryptosporidium andersoni TaxID=117008 RepID=A0A1J4MW44_9CRYT|nr:hypothetical protein cand_019620 [Cryptosporidium andersoni]
MSLNSRLDKDLSDEESQNLITPEFLNELIVEDYSQVRLGPSVALVMSCITKGFIDDVIQKSYEIALHQGRDQILSDDILLYLKRKYPDSGLAELCEISDISSEGSAIRNIQQFNSDRLRKMAAVKRRMKEVKSKHRIGQRLKQIEIGKNSRGYERYSRAVRHDKRKRHLNSSWHPTTPDIYANISKSCFSGRLREWKLRLHLWGNLSEDEYQAILSDNMELPPLLNSHLDQNINIQNLSNKYFTKSENTSYSESSDFQKDRCEIPAYNTSEMIKYNIPYTLQSSDKSKYSYLQILSTSNDHIKQSSNNNCSTLSISPIGNSQVSTLLRSVRKTSDELKSIEESGIKSNYLSREIVLPYPKDLNSNFKIGESSNKITIFIPEAYRGSQIWRSCNFIRQCDMIYWFYKNKNIFENLDIPFDKFVTRYGIKENDLLINNNDNYTSIDQKNLVFGRSYTDSFRLVNRPNDIKHTSLKPIEFTIFPIKKRDTDVDFNLCYYPAAAIFWQISKRSRPTMDENEI